MKKHGKTNFEKNMDNEYYISSKSFVEWKDKSILYIDYQRQAYGSLNKKKNDITKQQKIKLIITDNNTL